jgi:hypothetical protein
VWEWWSYSPADFVLFSARAYYRLLELHNLELWPAHLLALAAGPLLLLALISPTAARGRLAAAIMGTMWIWLAWAFLWQRYSTINWAASYAAPVFAAEGLLFLLAAAARSPFAARGGRGARLAGCALLGFSMLLYPAMAAAMGRPWHAAEVIGIAPDPSALSTLAFLSAARCRWRWVLAIIPALWCLLAGMTLWVLQQPDFLLPPLGAAAALALLALQGSHRPER